MACKNLSSQTEDSDLFITDSQSFHSYCSSHNGLFRDDSSTAGSDYNYRKKLYQFKIFKAWGRDWGQVYLYIVTVLEKIS